MPLLINVVHEKYRLNTTINDTITTTRNRPLVIDANPVGYPFIFKADGPTRAVVTTYEGDLLRLGTL